MTVGSLLIRGRADMSGVSSELRKTAKDIGGVSEEASRTAGHLSQAGHQTSGFAKRTQEAVVQAGALAAALKSIVEAGRQAYEVFERLRNQLVDVAERMQRTANLAMRLGGWLTGLVTLPIGGIGVMAIRAAADLEFLADSLRAVMPPTEDFREELERLRIAARNPGLGFEQAIQGSVNLQSVGLSADLARRALVEVGNALDVFGRGPAELLEVSEALQKIAAEGRIGAERLNQLSRNIPSIRNILRELYGTTDTEALSAMGLAPMTFINDLVNELAKMPRAVSGARNSLINFRMSVSQLFATLGEPVIPAWTAVLNTASAAVEKLTATIAAIPMGVKQLGAAFLLVVAAIGPLILALGVVIKLMLLFAAVKVAVVSSAWVKTLFAGASAATGTAQALGAATKGMGLLRTGMVAAGRAVTVLVGYLRVATAALFGHAAATKLTTNAVVTGWAAKAAAMKAAIVASHAWVAVTQTVRIAALALTAVFWKLTAAITGSAVAKQASVLALARMAVSVQRIGRVIAIVSGLFTLKFALIAAAILGAITVVSLFRKEIGEAFRSVVQPVQRFADVFLSVLALLAGTLAFPLVRAVEQSFNAATVAVQGLRRALELVVDFLGSGVRAALNGFRRMFSGMFTPIIDAVASTDIGQKVIDGMQKTVSGLREVGTRAGTAFVNAIANETEKIPLIGARMARQMRKLIEAEFEGMAPTLPMDFYQDLQNQLMREYAPPVFDFEVVRGEVEQLLRALRHIPEGTRGHEQHVGRLRVLYGQVTRELEKHGDKATEAANDLRDVAKAIKDAIEPAALTRAELEGAARATRDLAEAARDFQMLRTIGLLTMEELPENLRESQREVVALQGELSRLEALLSTRGVVAPAGLRDYVQALQERWREMLAVVARGVAQLAELQKKAEKLQADIFTAPRLQVRDLTGEVQPGRLIPFPQIDQERFRIALGRLENEYMMTMARLREETVLGDLDEDAFERQGENAAHHFNQGVRRVLDELREAFGDRLPKELEMELRARLILTRTTKDGPDIRKFNEAMEAARELTGAFGDLADAMQRMSPTLSDALRAVETMTRGAERIRAGQAAGGTLGTLGMVSGGLTVLAGAISAFSAAAERRREQERQMARTAENTAAALDRLRASAEGMRATSDLLQRGQRFLQDIFARTDASEFFRRFGRMPDVGETISRRDLRAGPELLMQLLKDFGLTMAELRTIAQAVGIDIINEFGGLNLENLDKFLEGLGIVTESLIGFRNTLEDQRRQMDLLNRIRGIELEPMERLQQDLNLLATNAPQLFEHFFKDLEVSAEAGTESLRNALEAMFLQFTNVRLSTGQWNALDVEVRKLIGSFEGDFAEMMGNLTRDEIISLFDSMANNMNSFDEALKDTTNSMLGVPRIFRLAAREFEASLDIEPEPLKPRERAVLEPIIEIRPDPRRDRDLRDQILLTTSLGEAIGAAVQPIEDWMHVGSQDFKNAMLAVPLQLNAGLDTFGDTLQSTVNGIPRQIQLLPPEEMYFRLQAIVNSFPREVRVVPSATIAPFQIPVGPLSPAAIFAASADARAEEQDSRSAQEKQELHLHFHNVAPGVSGRQLFEEFEREYVRAKASGELPDFDLMRVP